MATRGWIGSRHLLAAGYRIIRLDMRGFGRSEPTPAGYRWSLAGFFADMEAVLAAENVDASAPGISRVRCL